MLKQRYGWIPDLPDKRDHIFKLGELYGLSPSVDLRPNCPPVYDQGQLGSCTAQAIAAAIEYDQVKQQIATFVPSRLFIYYNERVIERSVSSDSGAQLRDGIKSVNKQGCCPELLWEYDITQFAVKPPAKCYSMALLNKSVAYQRVPQSLDAMKACLASGLPWVFGFSVYASFESPEVAATGIVPMPDPAEQLLGGHAVVCVGYDDAKQVFCFRNSWGSSWAGPMQGYGYIPYAYLLDPSLASDFWAIQTVA